MPKARKRKKSTTKRSVPVERTAPPAPVTAPQPQLANRPFLSPSVRGPQSLIAPAIVALGCWGLAFSFLFFTAESNHWLYGGIAVLMALMWSFSFGVRARKLYVLRQGA